MKHDKIKIKIQRKEKTMKIKIKETKETKELSDVVSLYMTSETNEMTSEEFERWEKISFELQELEALIKKYRERYGDEVIDRWILRSDMHFVDLEDRLWTAKRELFDLDTEYAASFNSSDD